MAYKSESPASRQTLDEIGLSNLPTEWDIVRIGDLLSKDRGIAVGVMYPGESQHVGIPLIRAGDLSCNRLLASPSFKITEAKHHEYRRTALDGGELLVSLVGDVGRSVLVTSQMIGWNVARAIAVLRFTDPANAPFVRACLMSSPLQHLMQAWSNTTVQPTLNLKEIRQMPLPWPPAVERQGISEILRAFEDRLLLHHETMANLELLSRTLFKSWFVDFDPVRAKAQGREPEGMDAATASFFPSEFQDSVVGSIPKGWSVAAFDKAITVTSGGTPKTNRADYWGGEIPWFSIVDAPTSSEVFAIETEKTITAAGLASCSAKLLPVGATIISARGTVGKLAITGVPMAINQSCYALLPKSLGSFAAFFQAHRLVDVLLQRAHGAVFSTITRDTLSSVSVVIPIRDVALRFEQEAGPLMHTILNNRQLSLTIRQLRDTLLPRLISGRLRTRKAEKLMETVL